MPDKVKGTLFLEHLMEDHTLTYDKQITYFIFWLSYIIQYVLSAYLEKMLNSEKAWKINLF
jgi:hypothetical protein